MKNYSFSDAISDACAYFCEGNEEQTCVTSYSKMKNIQEQMLIELLEYLMEVPADRYIVAQFMIVRITMQKIRELGKHPIYKNKETRSFFEEFEIIKILENYNTLTSKNTDPEIKCLSCSKDEQVNIKDKYLLEIIEISYYKIKKHFLEELLKNSDELFAGLIHSNCPRKAQAIENNQKDELKKSTIKIEQKTFNKSEVKEILKISDATLNRWRNHGKIKFIKVGDKKFLYPQKDIMNMVITNNKEDIKSQHLKTAS